MLTSDGERIFLLKYGIWKDGRKNAGHPFLNICTVRCLIKIETINTGGGGNKINVPSIMVLHLFFVLYVCIFHV